jgi:hypothetical protein
MMDLSARRRLLVLAFAAFAAAASPRACRADLVRVASYDLPAFRAAAPRDGEASRRSGDPLAPAPFPGGETLELSGAAALGASDLALLAAGSSDEPNRPSDDPERGACDQSDPAPVDLGESSDPDAPTVVAAAVELDLPGAPADDVPPRQLLTTARSAATVGTSRELAAQHPQSAAVSAQLLDPACLPVLDSQVVLSIGDLGLLSYACWRKREGEQTESHNATAVQGPRNVLPWAFSFLSLDKPFAKGGPAALNVPKLSHAPSAHCPLTAPPALQHCNAREGVFGPGRPCCTWEESRHRSAAMVAAPTSSQIGDGHWVTGTG